jgi:hypothetical protein
MRKEIIITAVFLALCVLSVINIFALTRLGDDILTLSERSAEKAVAGEWSAAEALAYEALDRWTQQISYTRLVLRHADIEAASDALCDMVRESLARSVAGVYGASMRVKSRMDFLAAIETPSFESVF